MEVCVGCQQLLTVKFVLKRERERERERERNTLGSDFSFTLDILHAVSRACH